MAAKTRHGSRPPHTSRQGKTHGRYLSGSPAAPAGGQTGPDTERGAVAPEAYRGLLLATLRSANRPLRLDDILRITHLPRRTKKALEKELFSLQDQGSIVRAPGGWTVREGLRHVTGTLALQRAGMGFVTPESGGPDIYVHPSALNGAWHGDTVELLVLPGKRGPSIEGRVLRITARANAEIAAYAVKRQPEGWVCAPANQRLPALFMVAQKDAPEGVKQGDLLMLRPGSELGPNLFAAEVTANLQHEESPAAQERIVKSEHSIPGPFPPAALAESAALPAEPGAGDMAGRTDLTETAFVTIDGRTAKDFDDAVHVQEEAAPTGGHASAAIFRLRVAIADVSHYVRQGSALDAEARLRGNSCYFPLSVEPMLPEPLSNGLCSLQPGVPRLVMVADMRFDSAGKRLSAAFYPAVIKSAARLTYGQIERALLLAEPEEMRRLENLLPMLACVEKLARVLLTARQARGALDFDLPEGEPVFSEKGELVGMRSRARHFGHRMIEECMLAANEAVADFLDKRGEPTLYRVHQPPDPEKLGALMAFLARSGLAGPAAQSGGKNDKRAGRRDKKRPTPTGRELSRILAEARGAPSEYVVTRLLLRAMMQAGYQSENEGHYGLASACYCHFTSPIRRYADLLVHRALKHSLGIAPAGDMPLTRTRLLAVARHINETERSAAEAEREIHKRLCVLFLQGREGEHFSGVISGVTDFGLFVELPELLAEGMIRLSALPGDYYDFFAERQELRGRMSGRTYRLGMPLEVVLLDVSLARQEINLLPRDQTNEQAAKGKAPGKTGKTPGKTAKAAGKQSRSTARKKPARPLATPGRRQA